MIHFTHFLPDYSGSYCACSSQSDLHDSHNLRFRFLAVAAPSADTESFESAGFNLRSTTAFATASPSIKIDFPGSQIRFATHSGLVSRLQVVRTLHRHPYCSRRYFSFDGTSHLHCSFRQAALPAFAWVALSYRPIRATCFTSIIFALIRLRPSQLGQVHPTQ